MMEDKKNEVLTKTQIIEQFTDFENFDEKNEEHKEDEEKLDAVVTAEEKKENEIPDSAEDTNRKKSAVSEVVDFIKDMVICFLVLVVLTNFVARPVRVSGSSMYPTLKDGSVGFSNVLGANIGSINRFDVVVIYMEEKDEYLVKRVVGLPGETVSYTDGQLYVDGAAVAEDFLDQSYIEQFESSGGTFMSDVSEVKLGENEYYCLGDNRPRSSDSRYYGPFKRESIKSKGTLVFWPLNEFGVETW